MDWLRRNWPDLAIGIALVAVIAGIIATLLTGGSFFPLGPTQPASTATPPPLAQRTQPGQPPAATPGATPEAPAGAPAETAPAQPQPGVAVLAPDGSPADAATPAAGGPAGDPSAAASATAPAPAAPGAATPEPAAQGPTAAAAAPAAPTSAPASPPAAPVQAAADAPAPSPAATTGPLPSAAADPAAPFRVSVGAFGNPDNAARQAEVFEAAGYPVFTGTQGTLTIVLIGPYQTEAEAVEVAGRVRGGGFGIEPVIYRFQPDAGAAASSTPAPGTTAATVQSTPPAALPQPEPAVAVQPAASPAQPAASAATAVAQVAGRFLQVGAFGSAQSAQPLRERLASLGFATSEVSEDGMVKLLIGPFDESGLTGARQRLAEQGIQSFPR